jgi:hypothetical protein
MVWRYRRELRRSGADGPSQQLRQAYPNLAAAHQMHLGEPLVRWEVEARLLAGQGDESIAARCDISASVVQTYHDVFYDVRSALKADMYILCEVIGWRFWPLVSPDDHEKLLKAHGYDYGEQGVDAYLAYLREPPHVPASLESMGLDELRSLYGRVRTRLLVLLTATPVEALSPLTWLEMHHRWSAARAAAKAGSGDRATVLGSIQATADLLPVLGEARVDRSAVWGGAASRPPTVLEEADVLAPRVVGPELSPWFVQEQRCG